MKGLKASYTIEVSLIMFIVIMTLCSILYLAFYLHDRMLIELVLLEQVEQGRFLEREQTITALTEIAYKKAKPLLCLRNVTIKIDRGIGQVTGEAKGEWKIPFAFVRNLILQGDNLSYTTKVAVNVFEPEEFLRKISIFE